MAEGSPDPATRLLARASRGDVAASSLLASLLFAELRAVADGYLKRERRGHTLQPTALIHEAWLRLDLGCESGFESRRHFLRSAARAMRQVLVDHARARAAEKRAGAGPAQPIELADALEVAGPHPLDVLALDEALAELRARDPELAELVDLRFFGGLTNAEAADVLGLSERRGEHAWRTARAFLRRELERGERA